MSHDRCLSELLAHAPRTLFFTGKGGVGKTSLSSAVALALADAGRRVLLVSTDMASNLDEMLGVRFGEDPVEVPGAPGLSVLNIDPQLASEAYRQRVIAQLGPGATEEDRARVREELSGACTTEIAAFDAFTTMLTEDGGWDHVVFDTAPTGHTLRLLSLPAAWTGFLEGNDRGASCLGPHGGLKTQEARFRAAMEELADPGRTTLVLVARPDLRSLAEAARAASELAALGLTHQRLVVNGVFHASMPEDPVARGLEAEGEAALAALPEALRGLPREEVPLRPFDTVGLPALRALLTGGELPSAPVEGEAPVGELGLDALVDALAEPGRGLILIMGKGGVGKTTVAAALALALVRRGHPVHLTTTDPAGHLGLAPTEVVEGLRVDRIDPKAETERYIAKIMEARGAGLDEAGRALLREDLDSPCTEEVAVFHAFSRVVAEARHSFVVLDTAPTGHALLLMDATGAYHRQTMRSLSPAMSSRVVTPLMRLQDPDWTRVIVVTLPEPTPVSQAAALQEDLRRAHIEPFAWVLNRSLVVAGARDPLLAARLAGERRQMARIAGGLARRLYTVPWRRTG